jgi:hypothetical protein
MKSRLRKLRLIQLALIASIPIFGWIAEVAFFPGSNDWTLRHWSVAGLALLAAWAGLRLRYPLLSRSKQALAKDASNPKALRQWEAGNVIGMACAENVSMYGLVVRMGFGGTLWQASLFYAAGLVLLLLWTPRLSTEPTSDARASGLSALLLPRSRQADRTAQDVSWDPKSRTAKMLIGSALALGTVPFAGGAVIGVLRPTPAVIVAVGLGLWLSENGVLFLLARWAGSRAKLPPLRFLTSVIPFAAVYGVVVIAVGSILRGR